MKSPDANEGARETAITTQLRDGMIQAVNGAPEWKGNIVVLPGTVSRSRSGGRQRDGLTDISIFVIGIFVRFGEHDPHAIIECKRVAGNDTYLCREYVVEGIDRFRTGKYAGNHSIGFMVGYLIASDAETAAAGINRYMSRKSRVVEELRPSKLVNKSWAWRSHHPREGSSSIELHHAFLSFVST